jgi:hypothetical protein
MENVNLWRLPPPALGDAQSMEGGWLATELVCVIVNDWKPARIEPGITIGRICRVIGDLPRAWRGGEMRAPGSRRP